MSFKTIDPNEVSVSNLHFNLLSAIAPRPIAFASTVDAAGNINLSPFSFFNVFGANPPTVIFSPAKRVRDNTQKHTLENVHEVKEVVINIVNYPIVEQMSLASTEYDKGINEFKKAGFTEIPSVKVKPPRVGESPVALECIVKQIIETGTGGGAGNLIICEVVLMHIDEKFCDEDGNLDTTALDLVARMGGSWYCRAQGDALFQIPKPLRKKGIGVDSLPKSIKNSGLLSGNNLGRLGNVEKLPTEEEVEAFRRTDDFEIILSSQDNIKKAFYDEAKKYLEKGNAKKALLILMSF